DRIALHIIEEAEKKGILKPGDTIIETTSGNTGFSIAMVSIIKGYDCILAVSSKSSMDKVNMMKSMGAKVYVCPAHVSYDDPRSYYEVAKRLHKEIEGSIYINQYFNSLNTDAHYKTTGPEIWSQTQGKITHLVACSGTGGTISGTARYLKEQNPSIKVIGVDAYGSVLKKFHETRTFDANEIYPYRIEGLGKNLIPSATDFDVINEFIKVNDEQSAHSARELSRTEGLFAGYTSGAVIQAVKQLNEIGAFKPEDIVVLIFPDHGSRYMSKVYDDQWMKDQGFFDCHLSINIKPIEFVK
ncbi:cysteine synthase family protein, partial [Flavobacteriaceae bacterium]|nr:cysteine synthase family protein [Flavobacteriaceae bacterium]